MKKFLFWFFLIAAIVVGICAVYVRHSYASKDVVRLRFEYEMRAKNKALADRYAQQMREYEDKISQIRQSGNASRSNIDNEVANKIAMYEDEIRAKQEEQLFCDCRARTQSDSCVPGLFRLVKGRPSLLKKKRCGAVDVCRHAAYLAEIKVSEDGKTCEFKYDNKTQESIKPNVTIKFFDRDGRFLASAKNSWTFSFLRAGEKTVDKETIQGSMLDSCYFRVE